MAQSVKVAGLRARRSRERDSILGKRNLTLLSKHPNRPLIPPRILFSGYRGYFTCGIMARA